jgi:hypothetical protein
MNSRMLMTKILGKQLLRRPKRLKGAIKTDVGEMDCTGCRWIQVSGSHPVADFNTSATFIWKNEIKTTMTRWCIGSTE